MDDKINKEEFKKILREIPSLSMKERDYLHGAFKHDLTNGLNKLELRRKIQNLEHNQADQLDHIEVKKVKDKLLGHL